MNQTYNAEALRFVRCARRVNYFQRTRALVCDDYWQFVIVYKRITGEYPAMYVNEKPDQIVRLDRHRFGGRGVRQGSKELGR